MPGQGCPRGPLSLLLNNFTPALWLGQKLRRALILGMALFILLNQLATAHGQRSQLDNKSPQTESSHRQGIGSRLNSRGSARRMLRKSQSCPPIARRRLFTLQRPKSDQVVDRPRLAEVIKSRDSLWMVEGDWQAMTFERDTVGVLQAYDHIPDRQFNDVLHGTFANLDSLPLAVRQSQTGQQLYFYLANASPWRLRVQMQLSEDVSEQTIKSIKSLSQDKFSLTSSPAGTKMLTVDLSPYDLVGGSSSNLGSIESYSFEYLDDVASELRKRVFAMQVKLQQAQQAGALRILSNPKFLASESNHRPIHGWEIGQQAASRFRVIAESPDQKAATDQQVVPQENQPAGKKLMETYLQIRSAAKEVTWIRSQPIVPTETGRLSISVWLRVHGDAKKDANKMPEVRMAIDGQTSVDDYYRFGVVGREPTGSQKSLGTSWKRFAVHFDDLPSGLSDLRIGFDVVGEGVVEIGQVELFDRWFDNGDAKRITQLLASVDAMLRHPAQFDRCRRLLAEPWAVFLDKHFLLKPMPRSAQQPVPMFRPKVAQDNKTKQVNGESKVEQPLKR